MIRHAGSLPAAAKISAPGLCITALDETAKVLAVHKIGGAGGSKLVFTGENCARKEPAVQRRQTISSCASCSESYSNKQTINYLIKQR
jgi:hypothetical protein